MKDHESARSQLTSHITWFPSVSCAPPHISDNTSTLLMYIAKSGSSIFAFLAEPLVYLEWLLKEQRCACNDRDPWHERPWHPHELAVKTHKKHWTKNPENYNRFMWITCKSLSWCWIHLIKDLKGMEVGNRHCGGWNFQCWPSHSVGSAFKSIQTCLMSEVRSQLLVSNNLIRSNTVNMIQIGDVLQTKA